MALLILWDISPNHLLEWTVLIRIAKPCGWTQKSRSEEQLQQHEKRFKEQASELDDTFHAKKALESQLQEVQLKVTRGRLKIQTSRSIRRAGRHGLRRGTSQWVTRVLNTTYRVISMLNILLHVQQGRIWAV